MKKTTSLLIATAIAGSLSFSALAPAAFADDNRGKGRYEQNERGDRGEHGKRGMRGDRGDRGGLVRLMCSEEGAAFVEKALDRVNDRVQLTDEQKVLFNDFKTQTLAAQTEYADNCIAPTRDGSGNIVDRLKHGQTNRTAMVAAMDNVIPALEAFHDGLSDEQKAELKPQRGDRGGMRGEHGGKRGPRFGN